MLRLHRNFLIIAALAMLSLPFLYAALGAAKPLAAWRWMDIVCEGGTALMACLWLLITLSSRPGGLVTRLLAGGLAAIMLGCWADCMDEFFRIPKEEVWDNWLEGLMPLGMAILTAGLYYWRQEQFSLNEHLQKRERLFRDHRAFDRLTQLTGAGYLRSQLKLERENHPGRACALALLDIDGFHRINREHGQREGDRALLAVGHMLLLNLRNEDLLCRYAGDRFAILMPGCGVEQARAVAAHLCAMVGQMRHHAGQGVIAISLRHACAAAEGEAEDLLARLGREIDHGSAPPSADRLAGAAASEAAPSAPVPHAPSPLSTASLPLAGQRAVAA